MSLNEGRVVQHKMSLKMIWRQQALRMSDTECALRMQQRKRKLLDACRSPC